MGAYGCNCWPAWIHAISFCVFIPSEISIDVIYIMISIYVIPQRISYHNILGIVTWPLDDNCNKLCNSGFLADLTVKFSKKTHICLLKLEQCGCDKKILGRTSKVPVFHFWSFLASPKTKTGQRIKLISWNIDIPGWLTETCAPLLADHCIRKKITPVRSYSAEF